MTSNIHDKQHNRRVRRIQVCKQIGVTEQTYHRWRKKYGGIRTGQAKRLKELEKENARLNRLFADAELDGTILREAASGIG